MNRHRLRWWSPFLLGAGAGLVAAIVDAFRGEWLALIPQALNAFLFVWVGVMARSWFRIGYLRSRRNSIDADLLRLHVTGDPIPEPWERP